MDCYINLLLFLNRFFYVKKGCRREFLTEYLQEFMWRDKFEAGQSTFEALCGHIALIHRV